MSIQVVLPTLHADQVCAYKIPGRFKAIRCGRRWGKTSLGQVLAGDKAIKRGNVGWFAPDYKTESEAFNEISDILEPVKRSGSKVEGLIRTITGGRIDFWTLENERAGRSRHYHRVIIDEGAFTKPNMMDIWEQSIKPTLLDYGGDAWVLSNTNGNDPDNFFWRICNQPEHGFVEYHAPTGNNPLLPIRMSGESDEAHAARRLEVLDALRRENPPLVYQQEYLAEFVDWSGVAFFGLDKMLDGSLPAPGKPVDAPRHCDIVFATVDTATKTGKEHDGTAVIYWAVSKNVGHPLVALDWDIVQIEGDLLEHWLPTVFQRLEGLAQEHRARMGSAGALIEDKNTGSVLVMQAKRRSLPARAIDSKLTSLGKDERAISVSGYVHRGLVKICRAAYDKVSIYKGTTRNHMMAQVLGFRVGDKDPTRQDDLLDCFTYGVACALGDRKGF